MRTLAGFFKILGPGMVTGASDDDPSGIATYSQAGAQFGLGTLWLALVTFPLMAAVQEMCARIGAVTGTGLAGTLKKHYPPWVWWLTLGISVPATILNIGADIAGMGAVAHMVFSPIPSFLYCIFFTGAILAAIIVCRYRQFANILKWFCLVLLVYLLVPLFVHTDWGLVLKSTFLPSFPMNKAFLGIVVAVLGTTISPYLFFWQATMESEDVKRPGGKRIFVGKRFLADMRLDVNMGMLFSNIVMFFIILTCGTVLYSNGIHQIDTVDQAAAALKPVAGHAAYLLFALGVVGTGFLAIPVLAGSVSYMAAETFGWSKGIDKKFYQARPFYIVIIVALIVGLLINYIGISPIQGLIYTAILYGLIAPVIIAIILHVTNNRKIMGGKINSPRRNILGVLALLLMTAAAFLMIYLNF